jgi:TatD DNase family protein
MPKGERITRELWAKAPGLSGDGIVKAAAEAGVTRLLCVGCDLEDSRLAAGFVQGRENCWASIGIHPHEADGHADLGEAALLEAADHPRVIGLGETGLDYYYDKSDRAVQQTLFRTHIAVSRKTGLPLIIHTRDAEADTVAILEDELGKGAFPALIHCFTASAGFGQRVLELGLTISLSGIVTFKNARELQEFAPTVPADRLLVETDSPFLAPVPHRGRTCEPAYVADTARFMADLRGETVEELARNTTRNFFGLFKKAVR